MAVSRGRRIPAFFRARQFWLALILAGHIGLGLGFNVFTALYEATDEHGYVMYARYLQRYRALPVHGTDKNGPQAYHPPGYFVLAVLWAGRLPGATEGDVNLHLAQNPQFGYAFGSPGSDNKAYWLHDNPDELWPYRGIPQYVHFMRLLSLVFSALAVWLTYRAACVLYPEKFAFPLLAAGLVAFNPLVATLAGVVRHETAILATGAAVIYLLSRAIRSGFTTARWWILGAVVGLGVMFKANAAVLVVPVGIALIWETLRKRKWSSFFSGGVGIGVPVLVLDGWWFVRNQLVYGDWSTRKVLLKNAGSSTDIKWDWLPQALPPTLRSMLGAFGAGEGVLFFPGLIYQLAGLVVVIALVGAAWAGLKWLRQARVVAPGPGEATTAWIWGMNGVTLLVISATVLDYILTVAGSWRGDYMIDAYPSLALFLAAGLLAWFRPRWHGLAAVTALAVNGSLALYALFGLVYPAYAPPPTPTAAELGLMTPLDATVGDAARVLGYQLNTQTVRGGQDLAVRVYWEPLKTTAIPYTVFIHLFEPSVGSITQRDTYPGLGMWPTTLWTPGRVFVDTYRLPVLADAPAVTGAKLLFGLYDEKTMQRLPVTGANAGPQADAWVEFGNVQVMP